MAKATRIVVEVLVPADREGMATLNLGVLVRHLVGRRWEVTAPEAARLLGVRADELPETLRRATGMNYRQFRQDTRLRVAAGLLQSGSLSVDQVARAVGYACRETLDRTFTRQVGVSPAAWRRSPDSGHKISPIQPIEIPPEPGL